MKTCYFRRIRIQKVLRDNWNGQSKLKCHKDQLNEVATWPARRGAATFSFSLRNVSFVRLRYCKEQWWLNYVRLESGYYHKREILTENAFLRVNQLKDAKYVKGVQNRKIILNWLLLKQLNKVSAFSTILNICVNNIKSALKWL